VSVTLPRLVVAGLAGDTGKSLVSLGLTGALRRRGLSVAPFKKGPDFIDAAWLGAAAGAPGRNLDTFMMKEAAITASVARAAGSAGIAVVEGNRGLFDGLDAQGSHSTAQLARLIGAPVVLVVDATKTTRTVAALVMGCRAMDPDLNLAGVVLNRVGTARQEKVIREAVAAETDLPVLGSIPRLGAQNLPSRHLGLVTPGEHPALEEALEAVAAALEEHADVPALIDLANGAPAIEARQNEPARKTAGAVRIGVLRDRALSFYYPENLEALEDEGAELVQISPLEDGPLPDIDALWAGGGFPEVHAAQMSKNRPLLDSLKQRIDDGLPVWAECGGLMVLSQAVIQDGESHKMVGALPFAVEQHRKPQGHGYVEARVDVANPFLPEGAVIRGHEFHYSRVQAGAPPANTVLRLDRGVGTGGKRDGVLVGNVVATYTHLHALGTPEWAPALVRAASGVAL
jgi:cobyrinic acid a,c-diamide synthase